MMANEKKAVLDKAARYTSYGEVAVLMDYVTSRGIQSYAEYILSLGEYENIKELMDAFSARCYNQPECTFEHLMTEASEDGEMDFDDVFDSLFYGNMAKFMYRYFMSAEKHHCEEKYTSDNYFTSGFNQFDTSE